MQFEEANRLREKYEGKPCEHPAIAKEYYLGAQTGDYRCTTCGETFASRREWEELQSQRSGSD